WTLDRWFKSNQLQGQRDIVGSVVGGSNAGNPGTYLIILDSKARISDSQLAIQIKCHHYLHLKQG
ncbi:hypothetical protein BGZ76_006923, partial [Entomortierella beljakovae]